MTRISRIQRGLAVAAGLGLAGAAGACSTVSPEEMDTGLASLRAEMMQEMTAGDERLASRLGVVEGKVAALEAELEGLQEEFDVTVQRLEGELRFDVPVYFGFDDATVEEEDARVLERFGSVAQKYYPEAWITVEGFTDPAGSAEYNRVLGQRRADAVRDHLVSKSMLPRERLRTVSYGEDTARLVQPQGHGPGQEGWENRRVVLVIDHSGTAPTALTSERPTS